MKHAAKIFFCLSVTFICCGQVNNKTGELVAQTNEATDNKGIVNDNGTTVKARFNTPPGYERKPVPENSFANYLRNLPLKPAGSKVKYFNGDAKEESVYDAVVDMDIGSRDLQQCADAVIRLRGEYFYAREAYDKISFNLTNGFKVDYTEWMKGNRIVVKGNKTSWRISAEPSNTYKTFRSYMDLVFTYAGTLSLSKDLHIKSMKDISIGDVFIFGGSPGHAVIVVDVAENKSGEKIFLLAQSYMPAQEIQILKNLNDDKLSPWYSSDIPGKLVTPEWTFSIDQLKTW